MAMIADSPHEGVEPISSTRTIGPDGSPDAVRVAGVGTNGIQSTANGTTGTHANGARPDGARVNGVPSVVPKAGTPELAAVGAPAPAVDDAQAVEAARIARQGQLPPRAPGSPVPGTLTPPTQRPVQRPDVKRPDRSELDR